MLEKLLQHNDIGSKGQITYILEILSISNCSITDLKKACASKSYSFANSFDGVIYLLQWLDIIIIDNSVVKLKNKISKQDFIRKFCETLFLKLSKENQLHHFLNNKNIDFKQYVFIKNSLISLKFSPLRNFLVILGLFEKDNLIYNQFVIHKEYSKWFINNIVPLIDESRMNKNSLKKLESTQNKQKELGCEAEKFVLNYEKTQRLEHPKYDKIKIISEEDTNAGYDIISYKEDKSIFLDKFIEVKSYSNQPNIYWSKNEVEVAKREQDNYFLYIVDSNKIHEDGYEPLIIQNPYHNIFCKYDKEYQSWKFELPDLI